MRPIYCPDCIAEGRKREATHHCGECRRDRCDEHWTEDKHYVPPDTKTRDLFEEVP